MSRIVRPLLASVRATAHSSTSLIVSNFLKIYVDIPFDHEVTHLLAATMIEAHSVLVLGKKANQTGHRAELGWDE